MKRTFLQIGRTIILPIGLISCLALLSGCATMRHPVPMCSVTKAQISGMPEVRTIIGMSGTALQENLVESIKQESAEDFPAGPDGTRHYTTLAISGGAANGAYGAGLLNGWLQEGSRPLFKIITGVSTGAIIAPLVFLGKDYSDELERYYTTMSTKDVMAPKGPFAALFGDSLASSRPLARQIAAIVDDKVLERIACEHRRGRRLFVGTTDLDAQKFVVWDMGAIACRKDKQLFCKVILASASIPVMLPPVYFSVEVDGKKYDEMHVDGGTLTQVFAMHGLLTNMQRAAKAIGIDPAKVKGSLYIIRNGYMSARYMKVSDTLAAISGRAIDTIIDAQGIGDAYRLYVFTKDRGNDYNLAYIPPDFTQSNKQLFDPEEMNRLYKRGYDDAVKGYKWHKTPPGIKGPDKDSEI